MGCSIYVGKTKLLNSCTFSAQLICAFVFAYAKCRSSHDMAHISSILGTILKYEVTGNYNLVSLTRIQDISRVYTATDLRVMVL